MKINSLKNIELPGSMICIEQNDISSSDLNNEISNFFPCFDSGTSSKNFTGLYRLHRNKNMGVNKKANISNTANLGRSIFQAILPSY